ncbi:MAG: amidohydrolase [Gammaproteobacteria bacterium]|nr:amidohydrolase [Gammaproteobacteria bacterium]
MKKILSCVLTTTLMGYTSAISAANLDQRLEDIEPKVIEWRRHLHQHPELGNREVKTAKYISNHLQSLGLAVENGLAHTGVIALLKGAKPGPTVALRADMDALPVTERVDIPFASRVRTIYNGVDVGVMHACGHDTHVAMLMGTAEILSNMRDQLAGNVLFIFQPAEEGAPDGEEGGAELMLKEKLFEKYKPDVTFGQHVTSSLPLGVIGYRSGPLMASSDEFRIIVEGRQTHGSRPWNGVDPISVAAQIILSTQTIVSRQIDITKEPAVISFGKISGGVRNNIIPNQVYMNGTIRNFDMDNRQQIFKKLKITAEKIAESAGASAKVQILEGYPVTSNDPELTTAALPALKMAAGDEKVTVIPKTTGAEDFSFFANEVPSFFYFLGITSPEVNPTDAPSNHSDKFFVDERALKIGTKAMTQLTLNYLRDSG